MKNRKRAQRREGFTLLEVVISIAVLSVSLMAATAAFSSNLISADKAKRITSGTLFLGTVTEDVIALDYDNLLALNGNRIFDAPIAANAGFSVNLTVFLVGIDLIQVRGVLMDLRTNDELGRVVTLRRND